ncbi:MAG: pyruvate, water dikinase regulatory protein [Alphaproteobacteria bacterium]|nr:pyruvate, water dikinase regulatory protein [Alphaproteobacteria bacterium]MEC8116619.1 pyruvate, water dikinase regulatory protein [Pseudomonadota bacterium]MEC8387788.1 pyruvate, water dikinase regulatory protein [Pseudomonadota bacterium]MEC8675747.1 pyruvate, water dikinase regulatory protein [Pseudomonadota bacterium]|tara:strand:+ start:204 stop:1034 length:831 start_codon:yes stop_codon:yes gene_type:complete
MSDDNIVNLHLVSDATGETNHQVARACLVQFGDIRTNEHVWTLVRTPAHIEKILASATENPGPVLFTLVDPELRRILQDGCQRINVPCVSILDAVVDTLSAYLGTAIARPRPGGQHELDAAYFDRIEAMNFTIAHDDGQMAQTLHEADIVLLGVSRTSKTPTSLYLANRGYKTANIPIVPSVDLPAELFQLTDPFVIGLTNDPNRLIQIRQNRILMLNQRDNTDYVDLEQVRQEVQNARRLFAKQGWPVIDVTRRSIEETAAAVLQRYQSYLEKRT